MKYLIASCLALAVAAPVFATEWSDAKQKEYDQALDTIYEIQRTPREERSKEQQARWDEAWDTFGKLRKIKEAVHCPPMPTLAPLEYRNECVEGYKAHSNLTYEKWNKACTQEMNSYVRLWKFALDCHKYKYKGK